MARLIQKRDSITRQKEKRKQERIEESKKEPQTRNNREDVRHSVEAPRGGRLNQIKALRDAKKEQQKRPSSQMSNVPDFGEVRVRSRLSQHSQSRQT